MGPKCNYRQFHHGNAIYSLQVEQNRYISSLQIYLDSVKWKIFVTWVTKHFQWVQKGAKWGQNANYRQFHYGNAIYSLQVEQNRYISSLQIYLDSVKCKIFVTGVTKNFQWVKKGAKWGKNANYRQFHYGNPTFFANWTKSLQIVITDIHGQCEMKNIRYWGNHALPGG